MGAALHDDVAASVERRGGSDARRSTERVPWFEFGGRLSPGRAAVLGVLSWVAFASLWQLLVASGVAPPVLLVGPVDVLRALLRLLVEDAFVRDVGVSLWRIAVSFALATVVAYPVGLAMGAFPAVGAFLNPVVSGFRYLPAPSFVPLLLMALGAGDEQKVALLFIGVFFFLVTLIRDNVVAVSRELVDSAATLGASRRQALWAVIVPASLPDVVVTLRQLLAVSWTYLVVAEIVAADEGIGAVMMRARRFMKTDEILACILVIGLLGFVSDLLIDAMRWLAFPYRRRKQ